MDKRTRFEWGTCTSAYESMVAVDTITFIHPDTAGTVEVGYGAAFVGDDRAAVMVSPTSPPSWAGCGMDVVAARADGSVVCAFTVTDVETVRAPAERAPTELLAEYVVYRG